ncbi:MAG: DUF5060 domain-containing protein [Candidatus Solibacter usitatus]|nr:DUF5060 domain-containing protein [Candidatus Solibacter usitatus]
MRLSVMAAWLAAAGLLAAQQVCPPTPTYSPCDIVFELNDQEAAAHPNPYLSVDLRAEFRSPRARTLLAQGFWDGGRKMVIRFSPIETGNWDFRVTGNLERFAGKMGQVQATASQDAGFLLPANVHAWMASESRKAHLWMGDTFLDMGFVEQPAFHAYAEARGKQKFTHLRSSLLGKPGDETQLFEGSDRPKAEFFQRLDQRILALNGKGMFVDLILAANGVQLMGLFQTWQQRERFVRYAVSRYAAMHMTWQMLGEYESSPDGRALLREMGTLVKKIDPYQHPRSTGTRASSAAALSDGWMNFVMHQSADDSVGAIEHQIFPAPFVNAGFASETAAGAEAFRKRLWNASMNGEYPVAALDGGSLQSASAKAMTSWYEFFSRTRYWELEPYFEVDGGRAVALPDTEYIVYIEKPQQVEIIVEKHGYDVFWFNPISGELTKEKKEFKGDKFVGEPPNKNQDWVLHLSREGRKEGMLRSYKFESRPNLMQEVEQTPIKVPFEIIAPAQDELSISHAAKFQARVKRDTRATRQMMYLWTGEVPTEGQGYRVLGGGPEGTLAIPANLAKLYPAVFNIRVYALNGVGKLYSIDKVFRLKQ